MLCTNVGRDVSKNAGCSLRYCTFSYLPCIRLNQDKKIARLSCESCFLVSKLIKNMDETRDLNSVICWCKYFEDLEFGTDRHIYISHLTTSWQKMQSTNSFSRTYQYQNCSSARCRHRLLFLLL